MVHQYRREWDHTQERAEAGIVLATDQGFPYWVAMGTIPWGWALAEHGQTAAGIAHMRGGIAALRDTGTGILQSYFLGLLADGYRIAGQTEAGLATIAEALAFVERSEEGFYEAELYRLKGELLLNDERGMMNDEQGTSQPRVAEAEACFQQAIEIAQQQRAKLWELRASVSLARLWQNQGKQAEARQLLAEIYGWFTEGFDTADLQEAKALLEELA